MSDPVNTEARRQMIADIRTAQSHLIEAGLDDAVRVLDRVGWAIQSWAPVSETAEQAARADGSGEAKNGWGATFHRHTFSNEIHRDGGPECTQPGSPRKVYVFDPDILSEHEAWIRVDESQKTAEKCAQIAEADANPNPFGMGQQYAASVIRSSFPLPKEN